MTPSAALCAPSLLHVNQWHDAFGPAIPTRRERKDAVQQARQRAKDAI